jgi:hypothetical protein
VPAWDRPGGVGMNDLNVLALFKGGERFIFVFDDASRDDVRDAIRDAAADPAVAINWSDAAVLIERAAQTAEPMAEPAADTSDEEPARF